MTESKSNSVRNLTCCVAVLFCSIALVACSPASSADICADLNLAIDRNIKDIALSVVDGEMSDKSAVQQTARLGQINNRLSTILINLHLQSQNKCPPRQASIDASIYTSQAMSCYSARLALMTMGDATKPEEKATRIATATSACDFKSWNVPAAK